jgi:broad specificity phosphatase PhoE
MNYYLLRHAESYFSKHHIPYGDQVETAEILPEGIPITKEIGKYLAKQDIDAFFASPYKRSVQTARIIEKIVNKKFTLDKRIEEEKIKRKKETFEEMFERLENFLDYIKSKKFESVAICSHGWPLAALFALITKGQVTLEDLDNYPKPGLLIEIKNKSVKYHDFNK